MWLTPEPHKLFSWCISRGNSHGSRIFLAVKKMNKRKRLKLRLNLKRQRKLNKRRKFNKLNHKRLRKYRRWKGQVSTRSTNLWKKMNALEIIISIRGSKKWELLEESVTKTRTTSFTQIYWPTKEWLSRSFTLKEWSAVFPKERPHFQSCQRLVHTL